MNAPAKSNEVGQSANNAMVTRKEFAAVEYQAPTHETASVAVAAQAKAMVEARYVMALQRPRNWDQVRQDILKECSRPTFAHNKSAYYRKPIGAGVEGLGIRFTEVALRCMTNVLIETTTIYEDDTKEIIRVSVTDLESNLTYPQDVRISKTVERSKPMDDGSYISMRLNSSNKAVYTIPATDDELLNKRGALISKAQRTLSLRIIPGDIQDEAEARIKQVRLNRAAEDPDAERKRIADAFSEIGVKAADLQEFLGHTLDTCSPQQLVDLRGIYGAIRDGESTWKAVMDNKNEGDGSSVKMPSKKKPADAGAPAQATNATPKTEAGTSSAPAAATAQQAVEFTFVDEDGALLVKQPAEGLKVDQEIELDGIAFRVVEIDPETHFVVVTSGPEKSEQQPDPKFVPASPGMKKQVIAAMTRAALSSVDLKAKFGFEIDGMPANQMTQVLAWIRNPSGK